MQMFADFFFKRDPNGAKTYVKSQIHVPTPKGGLISESFSLWLTSPKMDAKSPSLGG